MGHKLGLYSKLSLIKPSSDTINGVYFNPFQHLRLSTYQAAQLFLQSICQHRRKGREQNSGIWILSREVGGPVNRHNAFSRASRAAHSGWTIIIPLYKLALLWVQKNHPFVPREIQGQFQVFSTDNGSKPALRIGMLKRIHSIGWNIKLLRDFATGQT